MHADAHASTHHRAYVDTSPNMDTIAKADVDTRSRGTHRCSLCRAHYSVRRDTYCNPIVYAFADNYRCSDATGYGISHTYFGVNCYSHQHSDTLSNANSVANTCRNSGPVTDSN